MFFNDQTGKCSGFLKFPPVKPCLPEVQSTEEDTNPYAQTGIGIWQMQCVQNDKIVVVHDIERCLPIAFDIIQVLSQK